MFDKFFYLIDEDLRPPLHQIHFPTSDNLEHYPDMMQEVGGVDVCYGGIGWCGHIAFWESHLGHEFGDDLDAYVQATARIVTLNPMTIMQNALHSFGGDWSSVPPKAATIGPGEVMAARYRSFWLPYGSAEVSWQRFIARLAAHGPVNTFVPGSILQTAPGTYVMVGGVADDVITSIS
jgi:glucosamine-6-phosphate deaminase